MEKPHSPRYEGQVKPLFPSTARFLGYPLLGLGVLAVLSSFAQLFASEATLLQLLIGPVFIALGYVLVSSYEGITLDTAFQRYRRYDWIAGFRRGQWLPLPPIVGITVAPFTNTYVQHNAISPSIVVREGGLYRVLLSVEGSRIGIIATIDKRSKALERAHSLQQLFGLEVVVTS